MDIERTLLLQDVAHLMNIVRTHILFDHEVFKTVLFLNYKETMGTICSTSVNPVSQSLKAVLPELSSQLKTYTLMLMVTKIPAWIICVLTFAKSMTILLL